MCHREGGERVRLMGWKSHREGGEGVRVMGWKSRHTCCPYCWAPPKLAMHDATLSTHIGKSCTAAAPAGGARKVKCNWVSERLLWVWLQKPWHAAAVVGAAPVGGTAPGVATAPHAAAEGIGTYAVEGTKPEGPHTRGVRQVGLLGGRTDCPEGRAHVLSIWVSEATGKSDVCASTGRQRAVPPQRSYGIGGAAIGQLAEHRPVVSAATRSAGSEIHVLITAPYGADGTRWLCTTRAPPPGRSSRHVGLPLIAAGSRSRVSVAVVEMVTGESNPIFINEKLCPLRAPPLMSTRPPPADACTVTVMPSKLAAIAAWPIERGEPDGLAQLKACTSTMHPHRVVIEARR